MTEQLKTKGFQLVEQKEIVLHGIKSIVFMGDVACTPFLEQSQAVLAQILAIDTDCFLILGDISFMGEEAEFEEVIDFCDQRVSVPIYALRGNHDARGFSQFLGLHTYALILDGFVVLGLDNARSVFKEEGLSFAEEILRKYPERRFLITFHVPPPTDLLNNYMTPSEWDKLRTITDPCRERIECMLAGHIHAFQEYYLDEYRIFISGGGGAALYNLANDPLKKHHAIKATFQDDATVELEVIPIENRS